VPDEEREEVRDCVRLRVTVRVMLGVRLGDEVPSWEDVRACVAVSEADCVYATRLGVWDVLKVRLSVAVRDELTEALWDGVQESEAVDTSERDGERLGVRLGLLLATWLAVAVSVGVDDGSSVAGELGVSVLESVELWVTLSDDDADAVCDGLRDFAWETDDDRDADWLLVTESEAEAVPVPLVVAEILRVCVNEGVADPLKVPAWLCDCDIVGLCDSDATCEAVLVEDCVARCDDVADCVNSVPLWDAVRVVVCESDVDAVWVGLGVCDAEAPSNPTRMSIPHAAGSSTVML
jgi:hypothetical protein